MALSHEEDVRAALPFVGPPPSLGGVHGGAHVGGVHAHVRKSQEDEDDQGMLTLENPPTFHCSLLTIGRQGSLLRLNERPRSTSVDGNDILQKFSPVFKPQLRSSISPLLPFSDVRLLTKSS